MKDLHQATRDMLDRLGFRLTGPFVEGNVRTALEFFQRRMPSLPDDTAFGFLRGMDLHSEVRVAWLYVGAQVAAFRREGEPLFKLFYTKPGTSSYHLGIVPLGRRFHRFRVLWTTEVLASRAADYVYASADEAAGHRFSWALPGGGGGIQYIIPNAEKSLGGVSPPAAVASGQTA
jgi:hypothetical protein